MRPASISSLLWYLVWGVFCLSLGCGEQPKLVKVHGSVTKDGQPFKQGAVIVFLPIGEGNNALGERFPTNLKLDGTYDVPGNSGKGIPPGKYRITIQQPTIYTNEDKLRDAFGPTTSRIVREVPAEPDVQEINLDLDKPTG